MVWKHCLLGTTHCIMIEEPKQNWRIEWQQTSNLITGVFLTSERKLGEARFLFLICYLSQIKKAGCLKSHIFFQKEVEWGNLKRGCSCLNQSEKTVWPEGERALLSKLVFPKLLPHSHLSSLLLKLSLWVGFRLWKHPKGGQAERQWQSWLQICSWQVWPVFG